MTWALQVPTPVWDVLRGAGLGSAPARLRWRPLVELPRLDDLILDDETAARARALAPLLAGDGISCVLIRGPRAGGRSTVGAALARDLGRGLVTVDQPAADDPLVRCVGPLAILLDAVPLLRLDLAAGETFVIPSALGSFGPVVIVAGKLGGVEGACLDRAVELALPVPGPAERERHWASALAGRSRADPHDLGARHRMTGGNIRRTAQLALAEAAVAGEADPGSDHVRLAARTRSGQLLDSLAQRVETVADWSQLALGDNTLNELALLERRCRHRERLRERVGGSMRGDLGAGVRALFTGPSGSGKTLAARTLAGVLDLDLYRLDLSMVVDKYIGETEKNLSRIFARAEEADIALLLDEGDSLLTRRTSVESSHDRYANLETNFLLQRLETFEGILLVTTNAADRIDRAFRRRMDVVIEFYPPEPLERWAIWSLHLPDEHLISTALLERASARCALAGGQIRNAVLHAALLATSRDAPIGDDDLVAAIGREYRKSGQVCPLPEAAHD
jgi:hypothetical protein